MKTKGELVNEHDRPLEGTESNRACGMKFRREQKRRSGRRRGTPVQLVLRSCSNSTYIFQRRTSDRVASSIGERERKRYRKEERERARESEREKESRHGSPARSSAIDSSRTRAERKAFSRMTFAHSRRLDAAPAVLADHPLRSRDVIVEFLLRQSASVSRLLAISPFASLHLRLSLSLSLLLSRIQHA